MWEDSGQRKKLLIFRKNIDHILDTKLHEFSEAYFQCIFSDLIWLPTSYVFKSKEKILMMDF